jgi:hypothetical protein
MLSYKDHGMFSYKRGNIMEQKKGPFEEWGLLHLPLAPQVARTEELMDGHQSQECYDNTENNSIVMHTGCKRQVKVSSISIFVKERNK